MSEQKYTHFPHFLDLEPPLRDPRSSRAVIIPCPFEATTSYRKGCGRGPEAILRASGQLETFDEGFLTEPCRMGIHTMEPLQVADSVFDELAATLHAVLQPVSERAQFPVILGGEHTLTAAAAKTLAGHHPGLRVVFLDAHADLRDQYEGSRWSHACAHRRTAESCRTCGLGIRILAAEEHRFAEERRIKLISPQTLIAERGRIERQVIRPLLGDDDSPVYLSIDLDVFDPAEVPAVGTPVPGGLDWYLVLELVEAVFRNSRVVALDLVELCPDPRDPRSDFLTARLLYKILACLQRYTTPFSS